MSALAAVLLAVGLAQAGAAAGPAPVPVAAPAGAPGGGVAAAADAPIVSAHIEPTEGKVGDVFRLTITAVAPRDRLVNLPRAIDLGPFAELDDNDRPLEEKTLDGGKVRQEFVLRVAAYQPGELTVPPIELSYLGRAGVLSARTEPVSVKIHSLIVNEPEPQLKENAPPVPVLERNLLLVYIAAGVLAAVLGAALALFLRRRLRARADRRPAPPPRPAHEIALERLDRLGAAGFVDDADQRPFYFALSEIVRGYLGARFGFDSLEMTTEELVDVLHRRAGRGLVMGEVAGWLSSCDLVKFAKVSPSVPEARGALEMAIRIVESTRPRPEPQVGGAGGPASGSGPAEGEGTPAGEAAHA